MKTTNYHCQKCGTTMKIQEVNKMMNIVTINIQNFVSNGGLIHLPISYFSKIEKQSVD